MQQGFLSQYFEGVAIKRLSSVEVDPARSHQHEFNGSRPLRNLMGDVRLTDYPARFLWLGGENEGVSADGSVTWYDAREAHPTRTEYRLYFRSNPVMDMSEEGDVLIVARRPGGELYMIVVKSDSTLENQLLWLFGVSEQIGFGFNFHSIENDNDVEIDFAVRYILEEIGIEIEEPQSDIVRLDTILDPYLSVGFPSTLEFSTLARQNITVPVTTDPDAALIQWMEFEERLFRRLERHLVAERLKAGFQADDTTDVDGFLKFSLSVHQRRKARAGKAFENHLEEVFRVHDVSYSRTKETENKAKPDFLFPSIEHYRNPSVPDQLLTMLGVKSTCKDRWRQVLSEAARIRLKHLLTLEPGISENQTAEMQAHHVQLVLPQSLHQTYKTQQQDWLMNLSNFINLVKSRQQQVTTLSFAPNKTARI